MSLSPAERAAGREWRSARQAFLTALNTDSPPDLSVPCVVRHVRHECAARGGVSKSFEFKEQYELNPELPGLAAGTIAWVWTQGKCACGTTGRSIDGRIVIVAERPPLRRTA